MGSEDGIPHLYHNAFLNPLDWLLRSFTIPTSPNLKHVAKFSRKGLPLFGGFPYVALRDTIEKRLYPAINGLPA